MWRLAGVTGLFAHPNGLGMITSANLPFYYYLMRYENSKAIKAVCFVLILIGLRVIMLTQSRTAFLGVITFGLLLWLFSKKKLVGLLAIISCFAILWQFAPQQTKDRFLTLREAGRVMSEGRITFSDEESALLGSMASRWELTERALIAFKENPIIGLGMDCFAPFNGRRWGMWFPPHNTYAQALAEMGIIGFFALSLVVIFTVQNIRQAQKIIIEMRKQDSFLFRMLSALIMYYFIYLVVSLFGIELYSNFWWLAGGLSIVILRIIKIEYQTLCSTESEEVLAKPVF